MRAVEIRRRHKWQTETLGDLYIDGKYCCRSLERPDLNNAPDVSCIPEGEYPCEYTRSNRLSQVKGHDVFTYEVLNVPNRSGIRIHSANFVSQLKGCICLGTSFSDLNKDGVPDVESSRRALESFEYFLNKEKFTLKIIYQNEQAVS